MEGVVSGDVGGGLFAGVASLVSSDPDTGVLCDGDYQIGTGSAHEFTAHNRVTQDNTTNTAKIKGVVIDGWLKGAKVDGQYQVISPCGILNVNVLFNWRYVLPGHASRSRRWAFGALNQWHEGGTGELARFHAVLTVVVDEKGLTRWDGWYFVIST